MSESGYFAIIPGWLLSASGISTGAKLFYGEVSRRCNERGYCWASNDTLARELSCGARTVSRYVAELEDAGAIVTEIVGVSDRKRRCERRIRLAEAPRFDIAKNGELNVAKNGELNVAKNGDPYNENNKSLNNTPIAPTGGERVDELEVLFARFWALYPKKRAKQAARRAWDKLKPDLLLCTRMSIALKEQMRSDDWKREGGRYIPNPATWLNGRRWEDELGTQAAPTRSPSPALTEEDEIIA